VRCSNCGAERVPGAKFCQECGTPVGTSCPGCGIAVAPTAKFCHECGESLGAVHAAAPPAATTAPASPTAIVGSGAERKLVTVLFADLVGFTTLAEGRDAEAVRELLSRYFDGASEIITRYGGTVEKFIGDAVMAVWGAPTTHEDDAERAVRAALDMVAAVRALGDGASGRLQARAGVLTGEAAVTLGATNQGLVAGDLVNTASRLQTAAAPGTVLVGETTRRSSAGAIAFEPAGELELKGKSEPVRAFRALRVVAKARGIGRTEGLEPPFVGRDVEFRLVRDAFHASGRERRARLVSITGEAGVGKSRLAWEFSKYTDGLAATTYWHEGRSPAYGEGVSFWALGEMVRKRCGLVEGADEATTRARITATVEEYVTEPGERPTIEGCLLALLGLAEPPAGGRDALFAGWRRFFERLAEGDPVSLLFEDIQWADDGLLDFVESLLEWSQSYPIFVLTLSRPELLDRRPTWGAARNATSLPLGPLGDEAMRALLAGLVPGLPDAAARTILERAGGMPLYAVETVRMLVTDGRLEPVGDGTYQATGTLDSIDVPTSLQALIAARLDALAPTERALLQDAAVLGQTFPIEALAAVTSDEPASLEPRLRGLVARDLLALDTDPRSPERGQYGFVQALIREVAYGTLSRKDRRARHLAAARYFESLDESELAGALATHYLAAYEAAPDGPEASALAGQARIALRAAAERAKDLGSRDQATAFLESAARLPGDETEQLALLEAAADVAAASSRLAKADALYTEVRDRALTGGDRSRAARATARLGSTVMSIDQTRARALLEQAIVEFEDLGPDDIEVLRFRSALFRLDVRQGHNRGVVDGVESIAEAAERTRDEAMVLELLTARGAGLPSAHRPVEAIVLLEGIFRRAAAAGLTEIADRARINLSVTVADDDLRYGRDVALEGLEDAIARGARSDAAYFASNSAEFDLHLGNLVAAAERMERILALELEGGDRSMNLATQTAVGLVMGRSSVTIDEVADAIAGTQVSLHDDMRVWAALVAGDGATMVQRGLAMAREDELNAPFAYLRVAIGAALVGDAASARAAADELRAYGRWGRVVAATMASTEAIALILEGNRDAGSAAGRDALERLRTEGIRFSEAIVTLGLGVALGDEEPGPSYVQRARALLDDLGAKAVVAMIDERKLLRVGQHVASSDRVAAGETEAETVSG
jgi:class 3 adenylate cyclase